MNVLFFLTPKIKVAYLEEDFTIRQALEKMEYHRYTSIPLLSKKGMYIGTVTEGDLLWAIKNDHHLNLESAAKISIVDINRHHDNEPINVDTNIEDLIEKATSQNFIPVLDDSKHFIGIIKRKDIINYCYQKLQSNQRIDN